MKLAIVLAVIILLTPVNRIYATDTSEEIKAKRAAFLYTRVIVTNYDLSYFVDETEEWIHCGNVIIYRSDLVVVKGNDERRKVVFCEYVKHTSRFRVVVTDGENPFECKGE